MILNFECGSGNPSEKTVSEPRSPAVPSKMNDTEIIILILVFFNFGPPLPHPYRLHSKLLSLGRKKKKKKINKGRKEEKSKLKLCKL